MDFNCYICGKPTPTRDGIWAYGHDHCKKCYEKKYGNRKWIME